MDKTWFENKLNECKAVKSEIKKLVKSLNMPDKDYHNVLAELDKDYGDVITFLTLKYMKYCGENNDFDEGYANFKKFITETNLEDLIYLNIKIYIIWKTTWTCQWNLTEIFLSQILVILRKLTMIGQFVIMDLIWKSWELATT